MKVFTVSEASVADVLESVSEYQGELCQVDLERIERFKQNRNIMELEHGPFFNRALFLFAGEGEARRKAREQEARKAQDAGRM